MVLFICINCVKMNKYMPTVRPSEQVYLLYITYVCWIFQPEGGGYFSFDNEHLVYHPLEECSNYFFIFSTRMKAADPPSSKFSVPMMTCRQNNNTIKLYLRATVIKNIIKDVYIKLQKYLHIKARCLNMHLALTCLWNWRTTWHYISTPTIITIP